MRARIVAIGNELVLGQTRDTNSAWLARQLAEIGITCDRHVVLPDEVEVLRAGLLSAADHCDLLLVTGGLGPTEDDLTRRALAAAMGVDLVEHEPSMIRIRDFFARRGVTMPPANSVQALLPRGAAAIDNTRGTAPGVRVRLGSADVFVMPGVPREMTAMFERDVRPILAARGGGRTIQQRVIWTFGMPESELGGRIADLMQRGRNPTVGTTAHDLVIGVRIAAGGDTAEQAWELLNRDATEVRRRLGAAVFGQDEETLQQVVAGLLRERGRTISTAESCTGGMLAKRLTDIPGSSAYFRDGVVTYSNEAKQRLLNVAPGLIEKFGAVSREAAEAMAVACRRQSGTDFSISITGIAGPDGGTAEKPVGLVFVGLADENGCAVRELRLGDHLTRWEIRDRTAKSALNMLRLELMKGGER